LKKRETMKYPVVYFEIVLIGFLLIFGYSMLRPFLPFFARDLDPTGVLVGFSISSFHLARIFIELPSGFMADRIGRRRPILLGLCLGITGTIVCAFSTSIYILILGSMLWGLGVAICLTSTTAFIIDLFESRTRGRALGTFQGIEFMGWFAGAPIGGFLAMYLSYASVFYITGAFIAIGFLIAFVSKGLRHTSSRPERSLATMSIRSPLQVLNNRDLFVTCITALSRNLLMQGVILTALPLYLHDLLSMSTGPIGIIVGIRTVGLCVATIGGGNISDKVGRKPVIFTGIITESLCTYLYTLASAFEPILLIAFVEGFGAGMISVTLITLISEQATPGFTGSAVGLYRTFMDIGSITGPMLIMTIYTLFDISACFLFGAILLLANILTLSTVKESAL